MNALPAPLLGLLLTLSACKAINDREWHELNDPDDDDVEMPTDCDPDDPTVTVPTLYKDADADGHGDPASATAACDLDETWIPLGDDCDDDDPTSYPGGSEVCDGADNDCDGVIDEDVPDPYSWYPDEDADGFGAIVDPTVSCPQPLGYVLLTGDCDDTDPNVHPDAVDVCDGVDNSCDGVQDCGLVLEGSLTPGREWARLTGDASTPLNGPLRAGDVNGDGVDDLVVGSTTSEHVTRGGGVYLFTGPLDGDSMEVGDYDVILLGSSDIVDHAGTAVELNDYDADGQLDVFVGAPGGSSLGEGILYVVRGPVTEETFLAGSINVLRFTGADTDDRVGQAFALGDFTNDGRLDLYVSAPGVEPSSRAQGVVYLIEGPLKSSGDASAKAAARIEAPAVTLNPNIDALGEAIATLGDLNADGQDDLGLFYNFAKNKDASTLETALYLVVDRVTADASVTELARNSLVAPLEALAYPPDLAPLGDIDLDGYDDFAWGQPGFLDGANPSGRVWVFAGAELGSPRGEKLDPDNYAVASVADGGDTTQLGTSVSTPGDVDGDGLHELWVGAPLYESGTSPVGAAALFTSPVMGALTLEDAHFIFYNSTRSKELGTTVGGVGDLNGLGTPELWAYSPGEYTHFLLNTDAF